MNRQIFLLLFCLSPSMIRAQETMSALFLHLDKLVYTGNEIIWFTGYMMDLRQEDAAGYTTLYVSLNDPVKKKTVLSSRFVLEKGICKGLLQLPDSFPAGEYALVAYTDHLFSHPGDAVFQQWISVRYNNSPAIPSFQHPSDNRIENTATPVRVTLLSDSISYHKRSFTRWKIRLTDTANKPVQGVFSVACVRNTRFRNSIPDIQHYAQSCFSIPNLLTDTMPPFFIRVNYDNKRKLKSCVSLLITHDNIFHIVETEKDGSLLVNPAFLEASYGSNILLSVVEKKNQDLYSLSIDENDQWMNQLLALRNFPFQLSVADTEEVFTAEEKEMSKTMLSPVLVKGKRKPDYLHPEYYQLPQMDGPCAAWVCSCSHWKCNACPPARNPVRGSTYLDQSTGMYVTYTSCPVDTAAKPFVKKIKAINYPRPFQAPDFTKEHPETMFYNTTLYWNYLAVTDNNGEAAFDFFTNDLSGIFSCIIQGISTAGLISASREITVINH